MKKNEFKHIAIHAETFAVMEKWKAEIAIALGVSKLSYTQFFDYLNNVRQKQNATK